MYFLTTQQEGKFCQWRSNAQVTFYTAVYGYKFKVFVDLNYRWYNPELSIGIRLIEGEYVDILPWPFTLTTTFTAFGATTSYGLTTGPRTHARQLSPTEEN